MEVWSTPIAQRRQRSRTPLAIDPLKILTWLHMGLRPIYVSGKLGLQLDLIRSAFNAPCLSDVGFVPPLFIGSLSCLYSCCSSESGLLLLSLYKYLISPIFWNRNRMWLYWSFSLAFSCFSYCYCFTLVSFLVFWSSTTKVANVTFYTNKAGVSWLLFTWIHYSDDSAQAYISLQNKQAT